MWSVLKFAHRQRRTSGAGLETGGGIYINKKYIAPVFDAPHTPNRVNFILACEHDWFCWI